MHNLCDSKSARLDLLCVIPLGQLATHWLALSIFISFLFKNHLRQEHFHSHHWHESTHVDQHILWIPKACQFFPSCLKQYRRRPEFLSILLHKQIKLFLSAIRNVNKLRKIDVFLSHATWYSLDFAHFSKMSKVEISKLFKFLGGNITSTLLESLGDN